jgi:hypothetical protein
MSVASIHPWGCIMKSGGFPSWADGVLSPELVRQLGCKALGYSRFRGKIGHSPNENKMSDGGRERASLGVQVWKSSEM